MVTTMLATLSDESACQINKRFCSATIKKLTVAIEATIHFLISNFL